MQTTIQGYKFEVPDAVIAYEAGQTLTLDEGMASTLKQVKIENLRNNFASKIKKALNGSDELTEQQLSELQQAFTEYASNYQFGVRQPRGESTAMDPVEREAWKLAKLEIRTAYKARHGEAIKGEQLEAAAARLMEGRGEDYMKRARVIVRERNKAAEGALEAAGL